MDTKGLKKIIKDAVREVVQEELKYILFEAVNASKSIKPMATSPNTPKTVTESVTPQQTNKTDFTPQARSFYSQLMEDFKPGTNELTFNTNNAPTGKYVPTSVNAGIEGTLHPGELGLDQIMNLMNTK